MSPTTIHVKALNAALRTERLELEPLLARHAEVLFAGLQDPRIYRWISAVPAPSVEELRRRWGANEARLSPDGETAWLAWAVRRTSDGAYLGKLDAEVRPRDVATNVGYLLLPDFWNQGYAIEAVRGVVEQFARHGVREARALVTLGNAASERVLVKAGFVRTRIVPENDIIRGVRYDDVEYVRSLSV